MKTKLMGLLSCALFSFCVSTFALAHAPKLEKTNEQIVRDFFSSLGQKDMKKVQRFLADDFSFQNAMAGKREYGGKTFTDWWYGMVNDATLLKPAIVRLEVIGNNVIFESTFHYKDKSEEVMFKGISFVHIEKGKITEFQEYKLPGAKM